MRISDWISDVCSSDLADARVRRTPDRRDPEHQVTGHEARVDFDHLKIGPAALVFQQQSIFRKSVKPRCPGIAQNVWREPFLNLAFNRITKFRPAAGTIPCRLYQIRRAPFTERVGKKE